MVDESEVPHFTLDEGYMVFIMQTDIFGHGLPIYTVNRHFEETDDEFDDGSHIVYFCVEKACWEMGRNDVPEDTGSSTSAES